MPRSRLGRAVAWWRQRVRHHGTDVNTDTASSSEGKATEAMELEPAEEVGTPLAVVTAPEYGSANGVPTDADILAERKAAQRLTWATRVAFILCVAAAAALTIAIMAIQIPELIAAYQNGLTQAIAAFARYRSQQLQTLLLDAVVQAHGIDTVVTSNATLALTVLSMNLTAHDIGRLVETLRLGRESGGVTNPLRRPDLQASLAEAQQAVGVLLQAVNVLHVEVVLLNHTTITPSMERSLDTIGVQLIVVQAALYDVGLSAVRISQSEMQAITTRELVINICTLVALGLLVFFVYIPMDFWIWYERQSAVGLCAATRP